MKGPSSTIRFNEAKKLLDYGFSNYSYKKLADKGTTVKNVIVEKGVENFTEAILELDAGTLIKTGQDKGITQEMNVPDKISAPVQKGQVIGEVVFKLDNNEIAKVNVVCNKDIKKVGFINNSAHVLEKWFNLCR